MCSSAVIASEVGSSASRRSNCGCRSHDLLRALRMSSANQIAWFNLALVNQKLHQ